RAADYASTNERIPTACRLAFRLPAAGGPPAMVRTLAGFAGLFFIASAVTAEPVDYLRDVKPLLKAKCYACHGGLQQKARLRLDTAESIRKGGRSGPAVIPGKSSESVLIEAVTGSGRKRMPPD